jgi:predicted PurR-regulated permease PerM
MIETQSGEPMKDRQADPLAPTPEVVRKHSTRESLAQPATLTAGLALVAAIYFAREILIPITLAVIFSFLVAPLVRFLERLRINQAVAVLVSVVVPLCIVVTIAGVVGSQIAQLAQSLPQYQETINAKVESIEEFANGRVGQFLGRAGQVIERVSSGQTPSPPPALPTPAATSHASPSVPAAPVAPAPSEMHGPPLQLVGHFLSALLDPLETAAIVFVLSIFMLIDRQTVRDRFIKLTGAKDAARTTIALDDTAARLSSYFLSQLGVNTSVGLVIGCALAALGAPSPVLWGVLAATLRFIPYVGVWIAAILAGLLAAAIDPGWSMVVWTISVFGATEVVASQFVEPLLYGHTTGLSPLSVVIAAIFWSWLWGPVGLILSTPLTLCLVVLGRYVEKLNFLEILLGEKPNIRSSQELYDHLAESNGDAAIQHAQGFLAKNTGLDYFDRVLIPAFRLLAESKFSNALAPEAVARAHDAADVLVRALPQKLARAKRMRGKRKAHPGERVLCVPCQGPFDDLLGAAVVALLQQLGFEAGVSNSTGTTPLAPKDKADVATALCVLSCEPLRIDCAMDAKKADLASIAGGARIVCGIYTDDELARDTPQRKGWIKVNSAMHLIEVLERARA